MDVFYLLDVYFYFSFRANRWRKYAPGPVRLISAAGLQAAHRVQVAANQKRLRDRARGAAAPLRGADPLPPPVGEEDLEDHGGEAVPPPPLPDDHGGEAVPPPPLPADDAAAPARVLGCTKCRLSPIGCKQCRRESYKPRGKGGGKGEAKAKAAPKAKAKANVNPGKGRGRGRGRGRQQLP